jgi:membrane-associated protein
MHLENILPAIGYIGIAGIIFAESGLLIGFFLPGDSLLFTAGFLASQGIFNIWILTIVTFVAAVLGDNVGYMFGHRVGRRLFHRKESWLFHPDHLEKAESFYEKHGKMTIIIARFVPIVRTFAPIVAGIGKMDYRTFLTYNIVGGFLWAVCIPFLGYFLGTLIPDVDKYLLPIVAVILVVSVAPNIWHLLQDAHIRGHIMSAIRSIPSRIRSKLSR